MNRIVVILFLLITSSSTKGSFCKDIAGSGFLYSTLNQQDTIKENQSLYTGKIWINNYHRINGDQFLFSNFFLPGTVSEYGKTYKNLLIRYDIFSDEITIPVSRDEILQLNKEIIDSFSITFENQAYLFSRIIGDTLAGLKGYKGYFYVLYNKGSLLFIKYKKEISPDIREESDGDFLQSQKTYFVKNNIVYQITSVNEFYKAFGSDEELVRSYVRKNKLRVSRNKPESMVPVIRYYDDLIH